MQRDRIFATVPRIQREADEGTKAAMGQPVENAKITRSHLEMTMTGRL
jgi:hypothetical protein